MATWQKVVLGALAGVCVPVVLTIAWAWQSDLPTEEVETRYRDESSRFAELRDGSRIHYWDRGDPSMPTLVLVHGSFDSAHTWELIAPELVDSFHLIVPDLPAHGLTGATAADDYSIEGMVAALRGLLDELGLQHVALAGNSLGGNVSWRFALQYPKRVDALVLIDSSGYPNPESAAPGANNPFTRWLYRHLSPKFLIRRGFERAVADPSLITDARVERSTAYMLKQGSRAAHRKRMEQRAAAQPYERIGEIQTPTLLIWGELDALVPVEYAKRFERDLPNAELLLYEGIGHMPQLEAPERCAQDITQFIEDLEGVEGVVEAE